jgi:hypothetical protein
MLIIGIVLLSFILLFIFCSLKVAHNADNIIENIENN